jgi:hypothetical protein
LKGLRWEAVHRTGADPEARGVFDIGSVSGAPGAPGASLDAVEDAVNLALAASGITVAFPVVERLKEPTDLVRVSPLRILLKDSPAGKAALGPGLNLTREQRGQVFDALAGQFCQLAGALLVGDIGVSIASGTGFLAIEIGGVEATTAEVKYENPFGTVNPEVKPGVLPASGTPAASGPIAVGSAPASGGGDAAAPTGAGGQLRRVADLGPLEERCESVHPFKWPSCSTGAALPVGLLGFAFTAGMAFLDWRHQRLLPRPQRITTT